MWIREEFLKAVDNEIERTERRLIDPNWNGNKRILENALQSLKEIKQRHSPAK